MRQPVACLGEHSPCPVSCIPNAGLPLNIDGEAVFPLEPAPFAAALTEFVERYGVSVVGGCCGTTPAHLRALVQSINHRAPKPRSKFFSPSLASSLQAQPLQQEPRPFLIGERLNAQGSRKFKQLLLAGDDDAILHLAQSQVESGAHALDLCVALTEEGGEAERMRHLAKLLTPVISVPLVIDSTEPAVIEAALRVIPGRSLINSTHLESGLDRAKNVFSMAKTYNAAVIALTIDEKGMAKTADRKLEIARRIHELAVGGHGLRPHDLIFRPGAGIFCSGNAGRYLHHQGQSAGRTDFAWGQQCFLRSACTCARSCQQRHALSCRTGWIGSGDRKPGTAGAL